MEEKGLKIWGVMIKGFFLKNDKCWPGCGGEENLHLLVVEVQIGPAPTEVSLKLLKDLRLMAQAIKARLTTKNIRSKTRTII